MQMLFIHMQMIFIYNLQHDGRHELITLRIGPITWTKNPVFFREKRDTTREERELDQFPRFGFRRAKSENVMILFYDDS